ncbi:3212_t:CDS:2, partial [Ambispora gerdemannii]
MSKSGANFHLGCQHVVSFHSITLQIPIDVLTKQIKFFRYFLFVTLALNVFENVNSQSPRYGHTANFIEQERKIYFIGGIDPNRPPFNILVLDVLVLDLSTNVSVESIPSAIPVTGSYTPVAFGTSVVDAENTPSARYGLNSAIDQNKRWHIYGGCEDSDEPTSDQNVHYFDFSTKKFITPETSNIKVRFDYTATAIGSNIIYIGGQTGNNTFVGMDEILIFNSDTSTWKKAKNVLEFEQVPRRGGHTAVKLNNTSILIYGGLYDSKSTTMNISNAVALLSIRNFEDFTSIWSLPVTSFPDTPYQNQQIPYYHTATIYHRYMIVAYGKPADANTQQSQGFKQPIITILDTRDMKWVPVINQSLIGTPRNTTNGPNGTTNNQGTEPKENNGSGEKKNNTGSIVGGVTAGITIICITIIVWIRYKRRLTQKELDNNQHAHLNQIASPAQEFNQLAQVIESDQLAQVVESNQLAQ